MKVVSTNRSEPVTITWKGKKQTTGIFKKPQSEGIYLTAEGVRADTIGNRDVHGDQYKACYLFDSEEYPFWKSLYPSLNWGYGMFGENLSVQGLVEEDLYMGALYQLGEARVRITIPREPCFKLGIRFNDQGIIERFIGRNRPGTYVEVLEEGWVRPGDELQAVEIPENALSIHDYFHLLFGPEKNPKHLQKALELPFVGTRKKQQFLRWSPK